jgi:maleylacetate reductase
MTSFVYEALPSRVIFGSGSLHQLPAELDRLSLKKALVLSTPGQWSLATKAAALTGDRCAGSFDKAAMHVPAEIAEVATKEAVKLGADSLISIGGGSTTGLAKAIALETNLPIVAIPTTYAGSEMTPVWGITRDGVKETGRDPRVQPRTVIYDAELTLDLPVPVSVTSGMNAIAHCVEALYARDANPLIGLAAEEGIRALSDALPLIVKGAARELAPREHALYGAWLAGMALGGAGMALHHKLCHTLGGSFGLPHAEVHTVILPHAAAYNAPDASDAMARVAKALGTENAPTGLWDLAAHLGAPVSLESIGMRRRDLEKAADLAVANPYWNPRKVTREGVRRLLEDAFNGKRP